MAHSEITCLANSIDLSLLTVSIDASSLSPSISLENVFELPFEVTRECGTGEKMVIVTNLLDAAKFP